MDSNNFKSKVGHLAKTEKVPLVLLNGKTFSTLSFHFKTEHLSHFL